jgi:maleylacetoacetate isomerase
MNPMPDGGPGAAVTLYGFWRSLATFRVRAALNLKGVPYEERMVDLLQGDQLREPFHSINPQHVLPVLEHGGQRLTQSLPIIEYIDETWTQDPLLPADAASRARVRALAQITASDAHPLVVPRVRNLLESDFGIDEAGRMRWARHWLDEGSAAIEAALAAGPSGRYAHGDRVTIADLALVSHVIGARLFGSNLSRAPLLEALANRCLALDAFARAHPLKQPGAPACPETPAAGA